MKINYKSMLTAALCAVLAASAFSCTKPVEREDVEEKKEENKDPEPQNTAPDKPGSISKAPAELTINGGDEFTMSIAAVDGASSYEWTIAESESAKLSIIEGQGTTAVKLKAADVDAVVAENTIGVAAVNDYGKSAVRYFVADITIKKKTAQISYKTKKYGTKTWMVEDCHEVGSDGKLGITVDLTQFEVSGVSAEVLAKLNEHSARYYTWYEAMTGISDCPPEKCPYVSGYKGKDDAGNDFVLDDTVNGEGNIQIRGCCPEGWHVANTNDWWDLLIAIKDEYKVPDDFYECGYTFTGGHDSKAAACNIDTFFKSGCTVKNMGNCGAWLRGGNGRIVDGGVWNQANETLSDAGEALKVFASGASEVGFEWYPIGFMKSDGVSFNSGALGKWGYYWFTSQVSDASARSLVITGTSLNFSLKNSTAEDNKKLSRLPVRCVKNY